MRAGADVGSGGEGAGSLSDAAAYVGASDESGLPRREGDISTDGGADAGRRRGPHTQGRLLGFAYTGPPLVRPLYETTEIALVDGLTTGTSLTLLRNGSTFVSQTVDDLDLVFDPVPRRAASPGNLTDPDHVVMEGSFAAGSRSEVLVYDGSSHAWWIGSSAPVGFGWTEVATTPAFGSLNDGAHSWFVGDFAGAGTDQVLLYSSVDGTWWLGSLVTGDGGALPSNLTWSVVADTSNLAWGNIASNSDVYVAAGDFKGVGSKQLYVSDAAAAMQYLGAFDAASGVLKFTSIGALNTGPLRGGSRVAFTGAFSGPSQQQILVYDEDSSAWSLGAVDSMGLGATWSAVGTGQAALGSAATQAFVADFVGQGTQQLLVFDGAAWKLAHIEGGALTLTVVSDWACASCAVYTGDFSASGRTELLVANRWGRIDTASGLVLDWSDVLAGSGLPQGDVFARVGRYTSPDRDELLVHFPANGANSPGDWARFALDPSAPALRSYVDANTRSLPPLWGDPSRLLLAGDFDGRGQDALVAYDSGSDAYWLGRFGPAAVALPSLLTPGDTIVASTEVTGPAVQVSNNVATEHNDAARSGTNPHETILTPAAVLGATSTFSVKATYDVSAIDPSTGIESAKVDAQPLLVHGVPFSRPVDAVYVATEAAGIFVFEAKETGTPSPLAKRQLVLTGESPLPWADQGLWCKNTYPTVGITSTPVIDVARQTLYAVSRARDASGAHHVRLHAIDLVTLQDRPASPVEITSSDLDSETFALHENQRPALLLDHGRVWVAFGGYCDAGPYAGYAMAYDARTLDQVTTVRTVPEPTLDLCGSGIWQGGAGPSAAYRGATAGGVFMTTGNLIGTDIGLYPSDAALSLHYPYDSLGPQWSPINESVLSSSDWDLSSSGAVVLPNDAILVGGKQGYLYVLDQNTMQCVAPRYSAPPGCAALTTPYPPLDGCGFPLSVNANGCPILQNPAASTPHPGTSGAPAIYVTSSGKVLVYVKGGDNDGSGTGRLRQLVYDSVTRQLVPSSVAPSNYPRAGFIAVAADASSDTGLTWFTDYSTGPLRLVAYDMMHLDQPEMTFTFAPTGAASSGYAEPTIIDGRVYIGYSGAVSVLSL